MYARTSDEEHRIGLILASHHTTLESELPELLRRQRFASDDRFTLHATRLRMPVPSPQALAATMRSTEDATDLLCDAQVDAVVHGCVPTMMCAGRAAMRTAQAHLLSHAAAHSRMPPVVLTAAGALLQALEALHAQRIALIAPHPAALTARLAAVIGEHGMEVATTRSLGVADATMVGLLTPHNLLPVAATMDLSKCDALVISACTQMPSLPVIEEAEQRFGLPVISATTATAFALLHRLGIRPQIGHAGLLLRGLMQPAREAATC